MLWLLAIAAPHTAAYDPDPGIPDTVAMVVSVCPDANASQLKVQLDLYVYNDSVIVSGTAGFSWDNPNLQMDSAKPSALTDTSFDLVLTFYEGGDINLTNTNQRFLFGGAKMWKNGVSL